jgi:uncharacterized membrane protein
MWIKGGPLAALLAASVLLNVFLIGIVVGSVFYGRDGLHLSRVGGPLVVRKRVSALPLDERQAFRQAMKQHHAAIAAARAEHRRMRRLTETDIAAPTFDRAKVEADFAGLRKALTVLHQTLDDALVDGLQPLSQSARARLVDHQRNQEQK